MSDKPTARVQPQSRSTFKVFRSITTRWEDNDVYGHINNAVYYSYVDTAVNTHLIAQGVLDIHAGKTIGLVIENHCNFFAPLAFPQNIDAGIRVSRIGTSSVRYEVGLFAEGEDLCAALAHFIHVYVNAHDRRPVTSLPLELQNVLEKLR